MKAAERKRLAERLKRKGVKQPYVVIDEARRANILVASALAMLENETGIPQANIFGGDYGSAYRGRPPFYHDVVTEKRVKALLAQPLNNGVGWTQLTYRPLVVEAQQMGGAHTPRYQMRVGFRVLRENFERYGSVREMFRSYNGSGSAAEAYADRAMARRSEWLQITKGK